MKTLLRFGRRCRGHLAVACVLAATAAVLRAETIVLTDGDRITGRILSEGRKTFRVQTPYGLLRIPRAQIERVVGKDGEERIINAAASAPPSPSPLVPAPPPVRLVVAVTGKTFWHAWDPKASPPPDSTLRFQVRLDEDAVATYADARPDPDLLRGALVNAFSFEPPDVAYAPGSGAELAAPESQPGRVNLKIDLPGDRAGARRLRVAYQVNQGTAAEPAWRDVAETSVELQLTPETPAIVRIEQDLGKMEYSKRRMKNVETFVVRAALEPAGA
jgi:hypothetical protein